MRFLKIMLVFMLVSSMVNFTFAQGRGQGRGTGKGLNQNSMRPNYGMNNQLDVKNPVVFDGQITKIETVKLWNYSKGGIQLTVSNKNETKIIQMGPEFYFVDQKILFKTGDQLKGTAYNGEYNKKPYLFAADIEINGRKLLVRDKNGVAVWRSRQGRGSGQGRGRRNL